MKRSDSLKRKKEFRYTYRAGRSVSCRLLALTWARNRTGDVRIGFSVSKKLGNAVCRNRVKRRLREAVTPLIPGVKRGWNLIFIARAPVSDASYPELCAAVDALIRKAGLWLGEPI